MPRDNISTEIKTQNRQLVYQYIRKHEPLSKHDIVVGLRLSLPTVTQNLKFLESLDLIDTSKIKKTGGRDATAYSYKRDGRCAIGVYITENHINVVCVNLSGKITLMKKEGVRFDLDNDDYLKKLGEMVESVKQEAGIPDENLLGVGIAVPSLVSDDGERVIYGYTHNFTGKTRREVAKYIPYKTKMFHDSFAAGFAEVWDTPIRNAVYISLNYSVGGSVIIDNHIYSGDHNRAGELGHMTVVPVDGKRCYCGKHGCLNTVCSIGALDFYTNGDLIKFFQLLEAGDGQAASIWSKYLDHLSQAIHNIRMLFDCSIIIGGYVGAYIGDYMAELHHRVDKRNCFENKASDYVKPCLYKIESTAAGAAIQLIAEFIHSV